MDNTSNEVATHMPDSMRVLLVDDHALVTEMISSYLSTQPNLSVETSSDMPGALQLIRKSGPFDIVLLDYNLPGTEGLTGLSRLLELNGGKVALFSGVASHAVIERALELGAVGFVPKTIGVRSLVNALRFMASGERYLPNDFIQKSLGSTIGNEVSLKPVERKVLVHLCEGLQNKEIARLLELSEVSVKAHVKSICGKLGAKNRTQAVIIAGQRQLC